MNNELYWIDDWESNETVSVRVTRTNRKSRRLETSKVCQRSYKQSQYRRL